MKEYAELLPFPQHNAKNGERYSIFMRACETYHLEASGTPIKRKYLGRAKTPKIRYVPLIPKKAPECHMFDSYLGSMKHASKVLDLPA